MMTVPRKDPFHDQGCPRDRRERGRGGIDPPHAQLVPLAAGVFVPPEAEEVPVLFAVEPPAPEPFEVDPLDVDPLDVESLDFDSLDEPDSLLAAAGLLAVLPEPEPESVRESVR